MTSGAKTVDIYLQSIPDNKSEAIHLLRETILQNIPTGFKEEMNYGMIGFVVPHSIYQKGYHCDPKLPLPFINLAAQKNFISFYHMGIYSNPELLDWFVIEYNKLNLNKLDMGKSCIRFKNMKKIPYTLIGELCQKMSVEDWIALYEKRGS
jgi:hypothetical protein